MIKEEIGRVAIDEVDDMVVYLCTSEVTSGGHWPGRKGGEPVRQWVEITRYQTLPGAKYQEDRICGFTLSAGMRLAEILTVVGVAAGV